MSNVRSADVHVQSHSNVSNGWSSFTSVHF